MSEVSAPAVEPTEPIATIGDTLLISDAYNKDELTMSKPIDIDGTILLPELGSVTVAGYTSSELEALLMEKYSHYFPQLDIKVEISNTGVCKKFFIHGEVSSPGEKPILGDLTLLEAVMQASPRRDTANLGRVRLIRADPGGPLVFEIDLGERLVTGGSNRNLPVSELDIIYVPPTLRAQVGLLLDRFRAWIREWVLNPPILIAAGEGH